MLLCGKYIQNYTYKILTESAGFCRRSDKNISVRFSGSQLQQSFT